MWLTTQQIADLEGIRRQTVNARIQREFYEKIREADVAKGGQGNKTYEIHLSSLDETLQRTYLEQQLQDADRVFDSREELRGVAHWRRDEAKRRMKLVEEWQCYRAQHDGGKKALADEFVRKYKRRSKDPLCRSNLLDWERIFERDGLLGLIPKNRKRGGDGSYSMTDGMKVVVEQTYLTQARRSIMRTYRHVLDYCEEVHVAAPTYGTVRRFIHAEYTPAIKTFYRDGAGKYRKIIEPIVHRDYGALMQNDLFCGDQRTMDTLLKVPHGRKYMYKRPILTMWLDVKSGCIVGRHLSFEADSYMIALSLRNAFTRFGLPKCVYMDCGKNYRSYHLNGKKQRFEERSYAVKYNEDTQLFFEARSQDGARPAVEYHDEQVENKPVFEQGVFEMLGINVRHSKPVNMYNPGDKNSGVPRSKPVEPMFNIFHEFEQDLPGWCGHNTLAMPEKLKREIKADKLLTLDEYLKLLDAHIDQHNHRSHGWRRIPSIDFYRDFKAVFAPERDLDLLLRPKKKVMVKQSEVSMTGQARGFGINVLPGLFFSSPELTMYSGQYVTVWYDPLDLSSVVVTLPDGEFIAEVERTDLMGWDASQRDYETARRRQKQARKAIEDVKQYHDVVDARPEDLLKEAKRELAEMVNEPEPQSTGTVPVKGVTLLTPVSKTSQQRKVYQLKKVQNGGVPPTGKGPAPQDGIKKDSIVIQFKQPAAIQPDAPKDDAVSFKTGTDGRWVFEKK